MVEKLFAHNVQRSDKSVELNKCGTSLNIGKLSINVITQTCAVFAGKSPLPHQATSLYKYIP